MKAMDIYDAIIAERKEKNNLNIKRLYKAFKEGKQYTCFLCNAPVVIREYNQDIHVSSNSKIEFIFNCSGCGAITKLTYDQSDFTQW